MGKLINRIPGSRLLISSLPFLALSSVLKALLGKLDIKSPSASILYPSGVMMTISHLSIVHIKRDIL